MRSILNEVILFVLRGRTVSWGIVAHGPRASSADRPTRALNRALLVAAEIDPPPIADMLAAAKMPSVAMGRSRQRSHPIEAQHRPESSRRIPGACRGPPTLVAILNAKELGESYDRPAFCRPGQGARYPRSYIDRADTGIDVVDDGEHSKFNWMAYARGRLDGLEEKSTSPVRFFAGVTARYSAEIFPAPTKT